MCRAARRSSSTRTSSPSGRWRRSGTRPLRWRTARWTATSVHPVPLTTLTVEALKEFGLSRKEAERSKNMFALGLLSWMYHRPTEGTEKFLRSKFAKKPDIAAANIAAFRAGWNFGETTEDFAVYLRGGPGVEGVPGGHLPQHLREPGAVVRAGRRLPPGGSAAVPGLVPDHPGLGHPARAQPAQELRRAHLPGRGRDRRDRCGAGGRVRRFAGGDDHVRPGRGAEVGDDRARGLARTAAAGRSTSSAAARPRDCRPRPSRPTCCRRCTAATARPRCPIVAPRTPADCFDAALEAARIALTYRTPVLLLSDGYLANGSEPWRIPEPDELPDLRVQFAQGPTTPWTTAPRCSGRTSATRRPWPARGRSRARPGLEHRIGGIEKQDGTGNISYDPANHDFMVRTRQAKIDGIDVPDLEVDDPHGSAHAGPGLGLHLRPDHRGGAAAARPPASRSRRPTCATSTPSRQPRRRSSSGTTRSSCRR